MSELETLARLIGGARVVDLAPVIENGMPLWPSHPPLVINPTRTHERDGYFCQTVFMAEHTGAHIDVPSHIHPSMMDHTVDVIPVDSLVASASVFDLKPLVLKPGDLVDATTLKEVDGRNPERLAAGDIALIDYGWGPRYKVGAGWREFSENAPGLSEDAVIWLRDKKVRAVGADTIACDQPIRDGKVTQISYGHDIHWLPNGIFILENLVNLDLLPGRVFFVALPLKIKGGSGSPLRPIALIV
ncbi:MAG: cyclase family protein [Chloroflexi bacterium]|nr:cyclase family protein [Chloroflexota bacterium]